MKKYFIVSDVHSFYEPLVKALSESGFSFADPEHILVLNGDAFDRGPDTIKVFRLLKELSRKNKLIYIKGNHEWLLKKLVEKDFPESFDVTNGTVRTCCSLAKLSQDDTNMLENRALSTDWFGFRILDEIDEEIEVLWKRVVWTVKNEFMILDFIESECITHLEIGKYIITHSTLPLNYKDNEDKLAWDHAMWDDPLKFINYKWQRDTAGMDDTQVLVAGHWHAFDIRERDMQLPPFTDKNRDYSTYISKNKKLIAIDTCTVLSHKVNVLTINEKGRIIKNIKRRTKNEK